MIVVADTSPINYLVLIDQPELLHQLYGEVVLPPAVHAELSAENTPEKVKAWLSEGRSWLRVQQVEAARVETVSAGLFSREAAWENSPGWSRGRNTPQRAHEDEDRAPRSLLQEIYVLCRFVFVPRISLVGTRECL